MTARTTQSGDTTTITVAPSVWMLVITIITALMGAGMWLQSELSDRPTRGEMMQAVEKIDKKLDRLIEER